MKYKILLFITTIFFCCGKQEQINEKALLESKIEAFQFLSKYHHQLHIMIGEEEGDVKKAYNDFNNAVINNDNTELLTIKNAILRIDPNNVNPSLESVKRLDYLVDYYQSGLSMQIEGIFRGYGYLEILDMSTAVSLYDRIKNDQ